MENPMKLKDKFIIADPRDNVATARVEVDEGTILDFDDGVQMAVKERIPFGHKVALENVPKGEPIIKYGQRIGVATVDISIGELVHTKNLGGERGKA
jgi:altronate dehydratase small subunit